MHVRTLHPITRRGTRAAAAALLAAGLLHAPLAAQGADPRVGLRGGWKDAASASSNLQLVAHRDRPEGWANPSNLGDFGFVNADLAFAGRHVFQGGYHGFQIWDISDPLNPTLASSLVCPGGQGDVSVYRNLLFVSVEETRGRIDCGSGGVPDSVSAERLRGVRIFDLSTLSAPRQVGFVQTCRGSHTHTLVTDPRDRANVYIYVSGTGRVRPGAELAGCVAAPDDPNTSLFRIEVIRVPVAHPEQARIVSMPRVFSDSGRVAGLWAGGNHGEGTQTTAQTNMCHDITVYPEMGLAAGACSGNGILLDIRDPANPRRIDQVMDPNFAYWHSATFSNDARSVLFSDEWGGGVAARCRESDRREWGADALFRLRGRKLTPAGYYKLPAAQSAEENCVAHNGSLIPVPGRDIMVQAWYQGGVSVFDFTDPDHPVEIAYFDRGPINPAQLTLAGFWSAYWYNGLIYGSEIGRGLDVFRLTPSEHLSANEIAAASEVQMESFNPQSQTRITWPARFVVARAYLDQLRRNHAVRSDWTEGVSSALAAAEGMEGAARRAALNRLAGRLTAEAGSSGDPEKVRALVGVVRGLAARR